MAKKSKTKGASKDTPKKTPKKSEMKKDSSGIREPIREKNKGLYATAKPTKKSKDKSKPQKQDKKDQSFQNKEEGQLAWLKMVTILLGIIFFIFLIIFLVAQLGEEEIRFNQNITEERELSLNNLELIVIHNEECEFCRTAEISRDINILLNHSNLTTRNISPDSEEALALRKIFDEENINLEFTPLFVLSKDIALHELYNETQFQSLFLDVDGYRILSPQVVQVKYLNEEFELYEDTIVLGNPDDVRITIVTDYFCQRCRILEGDQTVLQTAQQQGLIPSEFSPPIPQLLLPYIFNMSVNYSMNFVFAPVVNESTYAHKAAYCAHKQDRFIAMHASIVNTPNIDAREDEYVALAQNINLDGNVFRECFNSQDAEDYLENTRLYLEEIGVGALPVTVIGNYPTTEIMEFQTAQLLINSQLDN